MADIQTLPVVPFGTTDMQITRVGLGAWAMGGLGATMAWGRQDDRDSMAAIRRAVEVGVNWVDTAPVYGLGHSEEVVGRTVREMADGDRPYVFTKCGVRWDEQGRSVRVGAPDSIRSEIDDSLRRLGLETIDLYQMHWPAEDGTPLDDYWGTLCDLRASGKVRHVGLSNHDVAQLEAAERIGHVDSLQPPLSAIRRDAVAEIIPWCREHRTAVIPYSPMQAGLLTGAFSEERVASLPDDDWRADHPWFTGEGLQRNLAVADALGVVAERHSVPQPAAAVAWTLAVPGVTGAIVGARRAEQIDGWLPAASLELDDEDLATVAEAIRTSGAGSGPERP